MHGRWSMTEVPIGDAGGGGRQCLTSVTDHVPLCAVVGPCIFCPAQGRSFFEDNSMDENTPFRNGRSLWTIKDLTYLE